MTVHLNIGCVDVEDRSTHNVILAALSILVLLGVVAYALAGPYSWWIQGLLLFAAGLVLVVWRLSRRH